MAPGNLWDGWAEGLTLGVDAAQLLLGTPPVPCEGGSPSPRNRRGNKRSKKLGSLVAPSHLRRASQVAQLVKNPGRFFTSAGEPSSIPGLGRSPGEGNGNPLQYPCLGNPTDREPGGLKSMGSQSRVRLSNSGFRRLSSRAACRGLLSSSSSSPRPRDREGVWRVCV